MDLRRTLRHPWDGIETGGTWLLGSIALLGAYIVVAPGISLIPGIESYNERRTLQIGVLLLVGGSLLASTSVRRRWISTFRGLPFIAQLGLGVVVGLGILSSALAPAPGSAFLELSHFVLLFVAAGVVAAAARLSPRLVERILLGAVVLSAGLYAVRFFVGYGAALSLPELRIGRETLTGYKNIRFFNQYQTWTLPLLVGTVLTVPARRWIIRTTVLGIGGLWWAVVFVSDVTGTVLASGIAAAVVWVLFRDKSYRWLSVQGGALVIGGMVYFFLFYLFGEATPQLGERLRQVSGTSWRIVRWRASLDLAWTHPWLGTGPMHFAWPPYWFKTGAHPHNAFFQWLAEWGIPSTTIVSVLAVWGGWTWMQKELRDANQSSTASNGVRVGLVASLLAGTAHAMVSGVLVMPLSQMMLVLVGGWAWGRYRHRDSSVDLAVSARSQVVLAVLLVGAMAVVGTSLRDLSTIEERRAAFLDAVERRTFSPRYWQQGYIGVRDSSVIDRARIEW